MAGTSDKARFYLEQTVPELREFERKKIFSKQEINSIVKKRSDFEHTLNARGCRATDYAKYIEYEINLQSLARRRCKRLGIKRLSSTSGGGGAGGAGAGAAQQRIFTILDRATRRFQGDLGLWMLYLNYADKSKSSRKQAEILAALLRLHPTKPDLWIYAANYAMRQRADMPEARAYMLRGLRFCKASEELWIEYARLELIYIAKICARRKILGLADDHALLSAPAEEMGQEAAGHDEHDHDTDAGASADGTGDDISGQTAPLDQKSLVPKPDLNKLISGDIVKAIFEEAMIQFANDPKFTLHFFDMVAGSDVPARRGVLGHILENMQSTAPDSLETLLCFVRYPAVVVEPTSSDFPLALVACLDRLELALERSDVTQSSNNFHDRVLDWLKKYIEMDSLDPDIQTVLQATFRKIEKSCHGPHRIAS